MAKSTPPITIDLNHRNDSVIADIVRWFKHDFIGPSPKPNIDFCQTAKLTPAIKTVITKDINSIIEDPTNKGKHYKFGKTGHAPTRSDQDDYRQASYQRMYILYQSKTAKEVEELERYYSLKYKRKTRCDNKDTLSLGKMKSLDGYYYLYLVI